MAGRPCDMAQLLHSVGVMSTCQISKSNKNLKMYRYASIFSRYVKNIVFYTQRKWCSKAISKIDTIAASRISYIRAIY